MTFLIVVSEFNEMITEPMLNKCLLGFKEQDLEAVVLRVPGAAEIPIAIQHGIRSYQPSAIVTLGCLVKGETDHYAAICRMVEEGVLRLSLENHLPIVFEVLMTDSYQKAEERIEKGYHAAFVASKMAKLMQNGA